MPAACRACSRPGAARSGGRGAVAEDRDLSGGGLIAAPFSDVGDAFVVAAIAFGSGAENPARRGLQRATPSLSRSGTDGLELGLARHGGRMLDDVARAIAAWELGGAHARPDRPVAPAPAWRRPTGHQASVRRSQSVVAPGVFARVRHCGFAVARRGPRAAHRASASMRGRRWRPPALDWRRGGGWRCRPAARARACRFVSAATAVRAWSCCGTGRRARSWSFPSSRRSEGYAVAARRVTPTSRDRLSRAARSVADEPAREAGREV